MDEKITVDEIVGVNLNRCRTMAGLTQKALGQACTPPISSQQISKYELGTDRISVSHIVDFSCVLKCSLQELFSGLEAPIMAHSYTRGDQAMMQNYQNLSPDLQERVRALVNSIVKEIRP